MAITSKPYLSILKKEDSISGKNEQVFNHLVSFAKEMIEVSSDIEVVIWTWNINDAIGLDDLLLSKKLPVEIDLSSGEQRPVKLDEIKGVLKPFPKGQGIPVQMPTDTTCEVAKVTAQQEQSQLENQRIGAKPVFAFEQPEAQQKEEASSIFDFSCFGSESDDNEEKEENNSDISDHAFI